MHWRIRQTCALYLKYIILLIISEKMNTAGFVNSLPRPEYAESRNLVLTI